jgi:hypothetical protein
VGKLKWQQKVKLTLVMNEQDQLQFLADVCFIECGLFETYKKCVSFAFDKMCFIL